MQSDPHLQAIECRMPAGVTYASGERALMCAILADALACLGGWCRQPGLAADARQWVASTDRHWPCSFENICDTLGFDAAHLRRRLLEKAPSHDTLWEAQRAVLRATRASCP